MRRTGARSFRPTLGSVVTTALGTAWALIVLLPIYFLLLGSFRSESDYLTSDPWLPSGGLTVSRALCSKPWRSMARDALPH